MAKANKTVTAVELQQIKNLVNKDGLTVSAVAKKTGRGYETVKNAVTAKNINDFKKLQQDRVKKESAARKERNQAKRQNDKAQKKTAAEIISNAKQTYSKREVKTLIDGILKHTNSLEERVQTISSLLVESDDNVVKRLYNLEGRKGFLRRFLERF